MIIMSAQHLFYLISYVRSVILITVIEIIIANTFYLMKICLILNMK